MKNAVVCGAGGFIGSHLVKRLKAEGYWVRGVDLKYPQYSPHKTDNFIIGDLRNPNVCKRALGSFLHGVDEVYQLAAEMGGAGYVFTGKNDAEIMSNSARINLNVLEACRLAGIGRIFFSSSACVYPRNLGYDEYIEDKAYPADPDSDYGIEKLFSERLYMAYHRNYGMNVRIARFHNIFGEEGTWTGGREKAPAALCRKVAEAENNSTIEIWGDGNQTRSFLHIDECLEGMTRFMRNNLFTGPVNIGSSEMISINQLADMIINISGKTLRKKHIDGPVGVDMRNSNNSLLKEVTGWEPTRATIIGLRKNYQWIEEQVKEKR